jgi:hypothetical protein
MKVESREVPCASFSTSGTGFKSKTKWVASFHASEAVAFAKHLAADIRCLETAVRPTLAIEVVAETDERIHREPVFA